MSPLLRPSKRAQAIEPTLIRALRAGMGPETIDFGLGQTDLAVTEAVRRDLCARHDEPVRAPYTPNAGTPAARRAVADHVGVEPDQIMLTCGVQEGLAVAILGLCDPGDEVLVPDPGFPAYANLVRAAGASPVPYPLAAPTVERPGWGLDVAAVEERLSDAARLVILNNPSNPTGSVHGEADLRALLSLLSQRQIGWVSDEIYEDYVWEGQFISALQASDDGEGIVLSGLSKSHHMMGWRLGWMVGPSETLRALTPLHQHLVTCAPLPAQQAAVIALTNHDQAMARTRSEIGERRRQVLEALGDVDLGSPPHSAGAFYLFVDVRPWLSKFGTTRAMAERLLEEEDVMVIPGEGFGASGLGHLRLAYTIGGEQLSEGLGRLRKFLMRH